MVGTDQEVNKKEEGTLGVTLLWKPCIMHQKEAAKTSHCVRRYQNITRNGPIARKSVDNSKT